MTASLPRMSFGVPSAMTWPKSRTTIRSHTDITSATSCSTSRMPRPHSLARRTTSSLSSRVSRVVESCRRLVEEEHRRLARDDPSDADEPPASVRELRRLAVEVLLEAELAHRGHRGAGERGVVGPDEIGRVGERVASVGRGAEVVTHRHVLEQLERLERARRRRPAPGGAATNDRWAAPPASPVRPAGLREPGDHVDERRLPGPVRADQPEHLARPDLERHVVDRNDTAEADADVARR